MQESLEYNLTKQQKNAIAEQLASFFYDYWTKRHTSEQKIGKQKEENVGIPQKD